MENKSKGKAVERIDALLDERSFVEIGQAVTARSTDFQLDKVETPSDGVVTGYGLINGCPVYVYSQDASVLGGSIGEMHARKIANLYDLAMKTGVAVIGMIDCAGIRLQESTEADGRAAGTAGPAGSVGPDDLLGQRRLCQNRSAQLGAGAPRQRGLSV